MKVMFVIRSRENGILIISEGLAVTPIDDTIEGVIVNNTVIKVPKQLETVTGYNKEEFLEKNKTIVSNIIDFFDGFTDRIMEMLRKGECFSDGVVYSNLDFDEFVEGLIERGEL